MLGTIKNIFEQDTEFVDLDPRRLRTQQQVTTESLYKRLLVQLPESIVLNQTVLDLGSCLGAAGHFSLTLGARHYTGVEIQDYYVNHSTATLGKYWPKDKFTIVHQNVEDFLDYAIQAGQRFDTVVASGIVYVFLDAISLLKKISQVTNKFIVIDSLNLPSDNRGTMLVRTNGFTGQVNGKETLNPSYIGATSLISIPALDIVMSTLSFKSEGRLYPAFITGTPDPYNTEVQLDLTSKGPVRYMVRYVRDTNTVSPLIDVLLEGATVNIPKAETAWVFDQTVADRFQHEAETNIPSYATVIDKSVEFAKVHVDKSAKIIDVGSALGFTMQKLTEAGFTNVVGVDNSPAMIANSLYPDKVICSDRLPTDTYKLVLANWTLHFVKDKASYIRDVYNNLEFGGYFILTDKTVQSNIVKEMYRAFKLHKGLDSEYINKKEQQLVGVMHSEQVSWYLNQLKLTGFITSDIIHSDLGFVTFLCVK